MWRIDICKISLLEIKPSKFNPPHASHMAGAWERVIGLIEIIVNSMFQNVQEKQCYVHLWLRSMPLLTAGH